MALQDGWIGYMICVISSCVPSPGWIVRTPLSPRGRAGLATKLSRPPGVVRKVVGRVRTCLVGPWRRIAVARDGRVGVADC